MIKLVFNPTLSVGGQSRAGFTRAALLVCMLVSFSTNAEDYLEMELEELLQVNITGSTLRSESLKTVPSAVTVFTYEQISALGFDYLNELLNLVPSYQSNRNADSSSGYTFSVRGRRNSSEAREVLLVVDGRVFSDPRTGGADGSLPLFPLTQIERVEIIRGPGSAIYGSGAFNGVINVISRNLQNRESGTQLSAAVGGDGRRSANVLTSHALESWKLNLYGNVNQDKGQDYLLLDETGSSRTATNDPRDEVALNLDLDNGTTRIQAAYYHLNSDNFYTAEAIFNGFNTYQQAFKQVGVDHQLLSGESLKTKLSLSYVETEQDFNALVLPEGFLANLSEPASDDPMLAKGRLAGKTWRVGIANDLNLNSGSSLQFGADWRRNEETDASAHTNYDLGQLARGEFPINFYDNFANSTPIGQLKSQDAGALYGQWLYDINERTRLTLGSRFDYYEEVGQHFSPRIGVVHQFEQNQTVKLLYGEAFRAPSLSEMGLTNNPLLVGNPQLDYEVVKTWDLIWQVTWHQTSLAINGFYNRYDQPIVAGLQGTTRTYINGEDESTRGASLELNHQITDHWLARISATQFFDLPDSAFREAEELGSLTINYSRAQWNWSLAAIYQGERNYLYTTSQQETLDAYWVATSKLRYNLDKNISLSLAIKNLADEEYSTPSQGAGVIGGVPNRGREWKLGMEWTF